MTIKLPGPGSVIRAATLSVGCGLAAGCAVTGGGALHAAAKVVATRPATQRFCADQILTPTPAQIAAINRYWTPLARSALTVVSEGKMAVSVPKKHLTPAQRSALRRAEWAWQAFGPKPRLVCVRIPAAAVSADGPAVPPQVPASAPVPAS